MRYSNPIFCGLISSTAYFGGLRASRAEPTCLSFWGAAGKDRALVVRAIIPKGHFGPKTRHDDDGETSQCLLLRVENFATHHGLVCLRVILLY